MELKQRPNGVYRPLFNANLPAIERDASVGHAINECLVTEVWLEHSMSVMFEWLQQVRNAIAVWPRLRVVKYWFAADVFVENLRVTRVDGLLLLQLRRPIRLHDGNISTAHLIYSKFRSSRRHRPRRVYRIVHVGTGVGELFEDFGERMAPCRALARPIGIINLIVVLVARLDALLKRVWLRRCCVQILYVHVMYAVVGICSVRVWRCLCGYFE